MRTNVTRLKLECAERSTNENNHSKHRTRNDKLTRRSRNSLQARVDSDRIQPCQKRESLASAQEEQEASKCATWLDSSHFHRWTHATRTFGFLGGLGLRLGARLLEGGRPWLWLRTHPSGGACQPGRRRAARRMIVAQAWRRAQSIGRGGAARRGGGPRGRGTGQAGDAVQRRGLRRHARSIEGATVGGGDAARATPIEEPLRDGEAAVRSLGAAGGAAIGAGRPRRGRRHR